MNNLGQMVSNVGWVHSSKISHALSAYCVHKYSPAVMQIMLLLETADCPSLLPFNLFPTLKKKWLGMNTYGFEEDLFAVCA